LRPVFILCGKGNSRFGVVCREGERACGAQEKHEEKNKRDDFDGFHGGYSFTNKHKTAKGGHGVILGGLIIQYYSK
jgi:hypothetical protein